MTSARGQHAWFVAAARLLLCPRYLPSEPEIPRRSEPFDRRQLSAFALLVDVLRVSKLNSPSRDDQVHTAGIVEHTVCQRTQFDAVARDAIMAMSACNERFRTSAPSPRAGGFGGIFVGQMIDEAADRRQQSTPRREHGMQDASLGSPIRKDIEEAPELDVVIDGKRR